MPDAAARAGGVQLTQELYIRLHTFSWSPVLTSSF